MLDRFLRRIWVDATQTAETADVIGDVLHPDLCFATERKIEGHYIAPGKPMQNGFVESFNGRLRD